MLEPWRWDPLQPVEAVPWAQHQRNWQWDCRWAVLEVSHLYLEWSFMSMYAVCWTNHLFQRKIMLTLKQKSGSGRSQKFIAAAPYFWCYSNEVLHMSSGIEEVGYVQWDLLGYLILAWTVVYCVIWKGLHNSGKVRLLHHTIYWANQGTRNVQPRTSCILIPDVYVSQFQCCSHVTGISKQ